MTSKSFKKTKRGCRNTKRRYSKKGGFFNLYKKRREKAFNELNAEMKKKIKERDEEKERKAFTTDVREPVHNEKINYGYKKGSVYDLPEKRAHTQEFFNSSGNYHTY